MVTMQLTDQWKKKKDVYSVVKALAKKTNLESTDAIWGRWAWIVRTFPYLQLLVELTSISSK
jgi:hypothetical protein